MHGIISPLLNKPSCRGAQIKGHRDNFNFTVTFVCTCTYMCTSIYVYAHMFKYVCGAFPVRGVT
jgi:hypothetical protein